MWNVNHQKRTLCGLWVSAHSVCTNYILSSNELSSFALKKKMSCFATQKLSWYKIEVKKMKFAISFTGTLKDISRMPVANPSKLSYCFEN